MWLENAMPEAREKLSELLLWPEEQEELAAKRQKAEYEAAVEERQAGLRNTAATLGIDLDSMWERQVRARALAKARIADRQRREAAGVTGEGG